MRVLRVIKSELRRIFANKTALICVLLVLAAIIVLVSCFLATTPLMNGSSKSFAELMEENLQNYEKYRAWYLYYIGEGNAPSIDAFGIGGLQETKNKMDFYKLLIDTQTTEYDYVDLRQVDYMQLITPVHRGAYSMFYIMKSAFYPLLIFAFIVAVLNCVQPYANGAIKNYYASPVGKRAVLGGKIVVAILINLAVWLIVAIWGLIAGAFGSPVWAVWNTQSGCVALSQYAVFITVMAGTLFAMLFITCLTVFIGQIIKKPLVTAAIVVPFVAVFALIYFLSAAGSGALQYSAVGFLPVSGLNGGFFSYFDYRLWITYFAHIFFSAALIIESLIRIKYKE